MLFTYLIAMLTKTKPKSLDQFWDLAGELKMSAEIESSQNLQRLRTLNLEQIKAVCIQYRFFVQRYPSNLALLLSKLPESDLLSSLAVILSEELGDGDKTQSHLQLWDNFLISLGVSHPNEQQILSGNFSILTQLADNIRSKSPLYGVGVVGMAGECLCQVYLTHMHKNLFKNPLMRQQSGLDRTFWDLHIGEHDVEHTHLVRQRIEELVSSESNCIEDLSEGYIFGKQKWDLFWDNAFAAIA